MAVDHNDVEQIAALAHIDLSRAELRRFQSEFGRILEYFSRIRAECGAREPSAELESAVNITREDRVRPSLSQAQVLRNAPDTDGEYFRVPRVLPDPET